MKDDRPGLSSNYKKICVSNDSDDAEIDLVVVLPKKPKGGNVKESWLRGFYCIDFANFSAKLEGCDELFESEFLRIFKYHLNKWACVPAGICDPWRSESPTSLQ